MSVAIFSDEELKGIIDAFVAIGVERNEAEETMAALGVANRAASMLTYGEERMSLTSPISDFCLDSCGFLIHPL